MGREWGEEHSLKDVNLRDIEKYNTKHRVAFWTISRF